MSSAELLKSIPELVQKRDAAKLAALRDHPDKDVRKAVRKALHTLKSKGVEVPADGGKAWSLGDGLQTMRGDLQARASLDARSMPGALRFVLSEPDDEGARLIVGTLGPDDRVLEFGAYRQTDGQRTRLLRDWAKTQEDRTPPVEWLKARIRWAREKTVAGGFSVPRALDELLGSLGDATSDRPKSFVGDVVAKESGFDPDKAQEVLDEVRFDRWPPLANLDGMLQKAAEIHGDNPQPQDDAARMGLIAEACKGDEGIRVGLAGPIANALDDTAADAWLHGRSATAAALADMATTLRSHAEPESLPWVHRVLGYQVASLLRAVTKGQGVPGMAGHDHDHDHDHAHDHDHDHDHAHDHVHDENCDHDHEHR